MNDRDELGSLAAMFLLLSVMSIGGVNTTLPEMHRLAVEVHRWMTDEEFIQLYAISQAAPGPNLMIVALVGWHVAGLLGGVVALLTLVMPTATLAWIVAMTWTRFREARWRKALQAGMIPITVGLVSASAFVVAETVSHGKVLLLVVTAVTTVLVMVTRIHPLIPLAAAGTLGYFGVF
jgi:chromate transporter